MSLNLPTGASATHALSRRTLLKYASAAALGATALRSLEPAPAAAATTQWLGHKPGRIYLGMSTKGDPAPTLALTGPIGLTREFYSWTGQTGEIRRIQGEHAAGRLPWTSFTPPYEGSGSWAAVASGRYDADIRARAQRYAGLSKPVIVTFNHEPHTDIPTNGSPADFARAWVRVHDVMKGATGLKNVVSVPILGEWVFNPINKGPDPQEYLTSAVLSRCAFLGIDLYQNASGQGYAERLPRILSFLDSRGHGQKMIGLGETGACNAFGTPSGARWWTDSWNWAAANTTRVGAISYWSSIAATKPGQDFRLTESTSKLNAFRTSLQSSVACRLS